MNKPTLPEMTSYAGAAGLDRGLHDADPVGVIAGIVTALLTCAFNFAYLRRRDMREQMLADLDRRELEVRLAQLAANGVKP